MILSAVNTVIPFLLPTCSRRPPCLFCPLLAHKHRTANLPCREDRRVWIHRYQHYTSVVSWHLHWETSPGKHWESLSRGVELDMKMARAVPVPCMSWDATPPSLPACNNEPKVANHMLSTTDHLHYFHHCLSLFYSVTLYQMEKLFDICWPWVGLLQCNRGSSDIDCQLLASTSFRCCKTYAVHTLTGFVRDRCKRLTVCLQLCMGQNSALFLFRTCLLPCKDVPVCLLQPSVTTFRSNCLICEEEEKEEEEKQPSNLSIVRVFALCLRVDNPGFWSWYSWYQMTRNWAASVRTSLLSAYDSYFIFCRSRVIISALQAYTWIYLKLGHDHFPPQFIQFIYHLLI